MKDDALLFFSEDTEADVSDRPRWFFWRVELSRLDIDYCTPGQSQPFRLILSGHYRDHLSSRVTENYRYLPPHVAWGLQRCEMPLPQWEKLHYDRGHCSSDPEFLGLMLRLGDL